VTHESLQRPHAQGLLRCEALDVKTLQDRPGSYPSRTRPSATSSPVQRRHRSRTRGSLSSGTSSASPRPWSWCGTRPTTTSTLCWVTECGRWSPNRPPRPVRAGQHRLVGDRWR